MKNFSRVNVIVGWIVFLISATTYLLTVEPTVSWWDCGEFITSAFKLEVGHPPGAPIFMIFARFFTLFAPDTSKVALMVNSFSALASAATIMFLFWTIVHLAKKLFDKEKLTLAEEIVVLGSGLTGALAFSFTDSFWFSAVEGEVYAFSSLFTAVVFWAILKWENEAGKPFANRWLILIAYLLGLSIGVHLLNLLAIPAIAFIYYFRNYKTTSKGVIVTLLASIGILGGIQYIIIPGVAKVAFGFDYFFVNAIGLPLNSGVLIFVALLVAASAWGILYTRRKKLVLWNTIVVSVVVILIGYSSFALIFIRASANPPMNQNNPDNAYQLLYYLNREQYGDRPLFHGPYYSAPLLGYESEKAVYNIEGGKYVKTSTTPDKSKYDPRFMTLFPRMYSNNPEHIKVYEDWGNVKGEKIRITEHGESKTVVKPSFGENLQFFFSYQLGYMYLRYFMWNFAGRQNDSQGQGDFMNGNWISGIGFLDKARTGPQENLPPFMKNVPSRNTYYMLPLLFGLIGFFYQYRQGVAGRRYFTVTGLLFLLTGIAIIVYLNQTPIQPRERDYAYAGSFYAFAIWIGLAVPALFSALKKFSSSPVAAGAVTLFSLILVPGILASENWDDHDRSGRYMARDYARNYLESCAPNAILFTYGDNDTFPLWYVQEVEGVRRDIRIVNLSYLGMDWYINQQVQAVNQSAPMPFSFPREKYYLGKRDVVYIQDRIKEPVDLVEAMKMLGSDDVRSKLQASSGEYVEYLPSKKFFLNIDKQKVLASGTVKPEDAGLIADRLEFTINKPYIAKNEWAILNLIAANNWKRPIYFDHSLIYTGHLFTNDWLQFEGLAYRLVPINTPGRGFFKGRIDSQILYNNVMNKFSWGNVNSPDIFLDDYNVKEIKILQARYVFGRLAEQLANENKMDSCVAVIDRMLETFPDEKMPYTFDTFPVAEQYYRAGAIEKGNALMRKMADNSFALLSYYLSLPVEFARAIKSEQDREISHIKNILIVSRNYHQDDLSKEIDGKLNQLITKLGGKVGAK